MRRITAGLSPICQQPRRLVGVDGDAFEVVVRHHAVQLRGIEVGLLQAAFRARHGDARGGVGVHHAMRAGQAVVERRVYGEARGIHQPGVVPSSLSPCIDLHQVAGGHFPVMQPEGIDQELLVAAGDAVRQHGP